MTKPEDAQSPAVGSQFELPVRPRAIKHGSDEHLTLLGAPQHLNLLTGQGRADILAFGRACMAAEREHWAKECAGLASLSWAAADYRKYAEEVRAQHEAVAAAYEQLASEMRA